MGWCWSTGNRCAANLQLHYNAKRCGPTMPRRSRGSQDKFQSLRASRASMSNIRQWELMERTCQQLHNRRSIDSHLLCKEFLRTGMASCARKTCSFLEFHFLFPIHLIHSLAPRSFLAEHYTSQNFQYHTFRRTKQRQHGIHYEMKRAAEIL